MVYEVELVKDDEDASETVEKIFGASDPSSAANAYMSRYVDLDVEDGEVRSKVKVTDKSGKETFFDVTSELTWRHTVRMPK